ncbi:MAG: Flp pilus assembly protein CpaB [Thermaerobacter sp.]|nr:Flp pilus assembly protein CpaB [Thermaerobacter sp.]
MVSRERVRQFIGVNRWLFVAGVVLAGAVYLTLRYVSQLQTAAPKPQVVATSPVVVVNTALSAYEPLTSAQLRVEMLPSKVVPPGAVTSVAQLKGAWTTEAVAPGVPLVASAIFYPKTGNVLAARINPADMAFDLPLSAPNAVDGMIQPGDHISLFTTMKTATGQSTVDFFNNIPVLAVNGSMAPSAKPTVGQSLVLILALPPNEISALMFAQQQAPIQVALDAPHSTAKVPPPYTLHMYQTVTP